MSEGQKPIDRLTEAQEAMLPEVRDEWIAIGLNCEPLDFPRARAGAVKAFAAANLTMPERAVACQSPMSAAICKVGINRWINRKNGEPIID